MKPIAVASIGMITPGAGDAAGSAALALVAARCFTPLPRVSSQEISLSGAKSPIPDEVVGLERLLWLGSHALLEAVDAELAAAEIGLVVCAPSEANEPGLAGPGDGILAGLAQAAELVLAPRASRVFAAGRGSAFVALPFACDALREPDLAAVCLLGVDSLVTRPRLRQRLEQAGALGANATLPGEAAAAIVLTRRPAPGCLALLSGLGMATEPSATALARPNRAQGLLAAIERAVAEARLGTPVFSAFVHDMAGNAAEMEELAWAKSARALAASARMESLLPCISTGDAGAAMGPMALAFSAFLVSKSSGSGPGICVFSAAEKRGAAILTAAPAVGR